jgi:hypothetical protein
MGPNLIRKYILQNQAIEGGSGGGAGAGAGGTSGGANGGAGTGAAGQGEQKQGGIPLGDGSVWRNEAEVRQMLADNRETKKTVDRLVGIVEKIAVSGSGNGSSQGAAPTEKKEQATPQTATLADVQAVEKRIAFREAMIDAGVPKDKREILTELFQAQNPQDLGPWMAKKLEMLGIKAGTQESTNGQGSGKEKQDPLSGTTNGGAPAREGGGQLPDNPFQWPIEVAQKMGIDKFHAEVKRFTGAQAGRHPYADFHEARAAAQSSDSVSELARRVAAEVKKG